MKSTPVFLFAFSNDQRNSLQLNEEWRQVERALQHAEDAGRLTSNITPGAIKEDIWAKFNRFHDQIVLFHYGGHSHGTGLKLEDSNLAGASLATLLGMENNLKLVILNGCSNARQVEALFRQGVPSVIATAAPIQDSRAIQFAQQFYAAVSVGRMLKDAFEVAAAFVKSSSEKVHMDIRTRGFELGEEEWTFEWGLYSQDEASLAWKLPEPNAPNAPSPSQQINNYGNVGKQINIGENHGDIHL